MNNSAIHSRDDVFHAPECVLQETKKTGEPGPAGEPQDTGKSRASSPTVRGEQSRSPSRLLRPLTVEHLLLWAAAKPGFELRLSALPPGLARLRWFDAVCALERCENATPARRLWKTAVLQVIAISLGLPETNGFYPLAATEDGIQILLHPENGRWLPGGPRLTGDELDDLRKRVCDLNGYTLPDESEDPALAAAADREQSGNGKAPALCVNINDLCAAMALRTGADPDEIRGWPVKKFNGMASAVTRMEQYRTCALLEATGLFAFRHGNPVPSWLLARKPGMPSGIAFVSELNDSAAGLI